MDKLEHLPGEMHMRSQCRCITNLRSLSGTPKCCATQVEWAEAWLKKMPHLQHLLKTLWSLAPTSSAAERHWSAQGCVNSDDRARLSDDRGSKLASIYFNIRALDMHDELKARHVDSEEQAAWRKRLVARASFPHKEVGWVPHANYGTAEPAGEEFSGMHGDEGDIDDAASSSDDEEGEEEACDWEEAATATIRPLPARVPADLRTGDKIVVFFSKPWSKWFVGTVDKVDMRCKQLPVFATFADGKSRLGLDPEMYGVTGGKQWALIAEAEPSESAMEADSDGDDDAEAGPSSFTQDRRKRSRAQ